MDSWIGSKMHRASGLDQDLIRSQMFGDCRSNADFLRILMNEVAASQGLRRWAVWGARQSALHADDQSANARCALYPHDS